MAGKSTINWIAVRTAYVVKGWSAQTCADEFGVDVTTVKKRASAEGWTAERTRITTEGHHAVVEEMRAAVADTLANHVNLTDKVTKIIDKWIEEDVAASKPGRSRGEVIKVYMEAMNLALRLGREVRGIKPGEASEESTTEDNTVRIVREVVVAPAEVESA